MRPLQFPSASGLVIAGALVFGGFVELGAATATTAVVSADAEIHPAQLRGVGVARLWNTASAQTRGQGTARLRDDPGAQTGRQA